MRETLSRRQFVGGTAAAGIGLMAGNSSYGAEKPALLGGTPVHKGGWPKWPQWRSRGSRTSSRCCAADGGAGRAAAEKCRNSKRPTLSCSVPSAAWPPPAAPRR